MAMELIKENIECDQLLGEGTVENVIKEEYVIPDTQPDVKKVLILDAKPKMSKKEVMQHKVYVEGEIKYNILYLASVEESSEVFNVVYTKEFSTYIDVNNAGVDMTCSVDCDIEHIECKIINERKIAIEGIVELSTSVYKKNQFEIIKDVDSVEDIQLLKNPSFIDKIIGKADGELISKAHIQVPMEKPEVGKILNCDVMVHKSDVKLLEGKVQVEAFTKVKILYKAVDSREMYNLEEDVFVSEEIECENVDEFMDSNTEFIVEDIDFNVTPDDLGENRVIDVEALIKCETKIMHREEIDMIEDAYSPSSMLRMEKKSYELNMNLGHNTLETIIRENIDVNNNLKPLEIIMVTGKTSITDKKIVEDKVVVDGLLNVNILYKAEENDRYVAANEDIPFNCAVDIPGAKIDMESVAKVYLENIEAGVEAGTIAIKAVAKVYAKVNYITNKEFLVDITPVEDEVVEKKASITIYVAQDGDTLWKIAKKYSATVEDLIKINELESENIIVGQKMIIPGRAII